MHGSVEMNQSPGLSKDASGVLPRLRPNQFVVSVLTGAILAPLWMAGFILLVLVSFGLTSEISSMLSVYTYPMRPKLVFWLAFLSPLYFVGIPWLAYALGRGHGPGLKVTLFTFMLFSSASYILLVAFWTLPL